MKPGSGVGVTWHRWFLFGEDQARCWGTWRGPGPRARPGQSRKAASVSRTVSGDKVATSVRDGRVGQAGEGARVVGRRRGPGARRDQPGATSETSARGFLPPGGASLSAADAGAARRAEQLRKGWAGCVRSNEAWTHQKTHSDERWWRPQLGPTGGRGLGQRVGGLGGGLEIDRDWGVEGGERGGCRAWLPGGNHRIFTDWGARGLPSQGAAGPGTS